jgi:hypothetical protein
LCDIEAQVSVLSSKIYDKAQDHNLDLAPTSTKLIMGDGRTIRPLGIACNMSVNIFGKCIPTDFFVIDAYHSNYDHIILGRPFLKLVDAVLDAGKGKVTMNLNGKKYTYNFFCVSKHPSPFPPEDEEVEGVDSLCFVETLRDPLQRAMENQANDQQDGELEETTKGLEPRFKTRRTRTPVKTITGKMSCSRLVVSSSDQFPTRGTPSDKSLPRTTSYSFARAVSASDPGASHTTWRDPGAGAPPPQRVGAVPHAMQIHQPAPRNGSWPRQEP